MNDKQTIAEIHFTAYRSIETLRSRLRLIAREHSDRIAKLRGLMSQLATHPDPEASLNGIDRLSLAPDVQALLDNPTHDL